MFSYDFSIMFGLCPAYSWPSSLPFIPEERGACSIKSAALTSYLKLSFGCFKKPDFDAGEVQEGLSACPN